MFQEDNQGLYLIVETEDTMRFKRHAIDEGWEHVPVPSSPIQVDHALGFNRESRRQPISNRVNYSAKVASPPASDQPPPTTSTSAEQSPAPSSSRSLRSKISKMFKGETKPRPPRSGEEHRRDRSESRLGRVIHNSIRAMKRKPGANNRLGSSDSERGRRHSIRNFITHRGRRNMRGDIRTVHHGGVDGGKD